MKPSERRRWVLPLYVVLLALWVLALAVDFIVFGGPSSPVYWLSSAVVTVMLVVLIAAELRARAS